MKSLSKRKLDLKFRPLSITCGFSFWNEIAALNHSVEKWDLFRKWNFTLPILQSTELSLGKSFSMVLAVHQRTTTAATAANNTGREVANSQLRFVECARDRPSSPVSAPPACCWHIQHLHAAGTFNTSRRCGWQNYSSHFVVDPDRETEAVCDSWRNLCMHSSLTWQVDNDTSCSTWGEPALIQPSGLPMWGKLQALITTGETQPSWTSLWWKLAGSSPCWFIARRAERQRDKKD